MKSQLILMRHGQSIWNKKNLFTGWVDVPLSPEGITEAIEGGKAIQHFSIDLIFTTPLIRALMTAVLAIGQNHTGKTPVILHKDEGKMGEWGRIYSKETLSESLPIVCAWQLNERMYGELQGLNKAELMEKFGKEQVQIWRRSFDVAPPGGESLAMTAARAIPYFEEMILPHLHEGKNIFIAAHGNSLRSIIMHLDGLSKEEVVSLELTTGRPILYEYENGVFSKQSL